MLEEALTLHNQGIQLLINNNINKCVSNPGSEKASPNDDRNETGTLNEFTHDSTASAFRLVAPTQSATTGYCVDSVEPKCNELKRLIDEFKHGYATKLVTFRRNKAVIHKLNIVISLSIFT